MKIIVAANQFITESGYIMKQSCWAYKMVYSTDRLTNTLISFMFITQSFMCLMTDSQTIIVLFFFEVKYKSYMHFIESMFHTCTRILIITFR